MYDAMVRRYVLQHVFKTNDRAVMEAALKDMEKQLAALERAYTRSFLAGQQPTLPDYFLAPIVGYLEMFPESKALLAHCPKLVKAHAAMKERQSWKDTQP
jgi:glutathione S-transferase